MARARIGAGVKKLSLIKTRWPIHLMITFEKAHLRFGGYTPIDVGNTFFARG